MAFDTLADGYLNSNALAACFDAEATLARMLEFEAALAGAQAGLGMIPASAAPLIAAACDVTLFDLNLIKRRTAESASPVVPMVEMLTALVARADARAAQYVHWGSTTQDVMDTASMLQVRRAIDLLEARLRSLARMVAALVREHRLTPTVARTLSQQAGPTTFGYKLAPWLATLQDSHAELTRLRAELPLQFGGAVGTLAAFGSRGLELRQAVANALALTPVLPWHTDRSCVRAIGAAVAAVAGSGGKMATDLLLMMQTEIGEVREAAGAGRGGSSALPHKRNPVAAVAVVAGARRLPGLLATLYGGFDHWHERAAGAWHAEWATLRDIFIIAGAVLEQLERCFSGLEVDVVAMRANLEHSGGLIMAEAVAMALATSIGREAAQGLIKAAVRDVAASGRDFMDVLAGMPAVTAWLGPDGLARAMEPENYLGAVPALIEAVLARYEAGMGDDADPSDVG